MNVYALHDRTHAERQAVYDAFIEWAEEHCPVGLTEAEEWGLWWSLQERWDGR